VTQRRSNISYITGDGEGTGVEKEGRGLVSTPPDVPSNFSAVVASVSDKRREFVDCNTDLDAVSSSYTPR